MVICNERLMPLADVPCVADMMTPFVVSCTRTAVSERVVRDRWVFSNRRRRRTNATIRKKTRIERNCCERERGKKTYVPSNGRILTHRRRVLGPHLAHSGAIAVWRHHAQTYQNKTQIEIIFFGSACRQGRNNETDRSQLGKS